MLRVPFILFYDLRDTTAPHFYLLQVLYHFFFLSRTNGTFTRHTHPISFRTLPEGPFLYQLSVLSPFLQGILHRFHTYYLAFLYINGLYKINPLSSNTINFKLFNSDFSKTARNFFSKFSHITQFIIPLNSIISKYTTHQLLFVLF